MINKQYLYENKLLNDDKKNTSKKEAEIREGVYEAFNSIIERGISIERSREN
ncbi:MAG: hypothetical protein JXB17_12805 [Bacteroidales bacterium]|nr:hypothetical protein [Bacteroidales bacterium]